MSVAWNRNVFFRCERMMPSAACISKQTVRYWISAWFVNTVSVRHCKYSNWYYIYRNHTHLLNNMHKYRWLNRNKYISYIKPKPFCRFLTCQLQNFISGYFNKALVDSYWSFINWTARCRYMETFSSAAGYSVRRHEPGIIWLFN